MQFLKIGILEEKSRYIFENSLGCFYIGVILDPMAGTTLASIKNTNNNGSIAQDNNHSVLFNSVLFKHYVVGDKKGLSRANLQS